MTGQRQSHFFLAMIAAVALVSIVALVALVLQVAPGGVASGVAPALERAASPDENFAGDARALPPAARFPSGVGELSASPNPCELVDGSCDVELSWSSSRVRLPKVLVLMRAGGVDSVFRCVAANSDGKVWTSGGKITADGRVFGLAAASGCEVADAKQLLASVEVTGVSTGPSDADLLDQFLADNGLTRDDVYFVFDDDRLTELEVRTDIVSWSSLPQMVHLEVLTVDGTSQRLDVPDVFPDLSSLSSLVTLRISYSDLSGSIPSELGQLTNLKSLKLHSNELSGLIPAELGQLTNLRALYLSGNELSGLIPSELGQLTNLKQMYLHINELSGLIPAELGQLTNLHTLSLNSNALSGLIPSELGQLTNLKYLSLNSNALSGLIPSELGQLTNLEYLFLSVNELSGLIPSELGQLTNLKYLSLSVNELSGLIPSELGQLTNLKYLYLHSNELSGLIPSELGQLTNLKYLSLHSNALSGLIPSELGGLSSLEYLSLSGNALSGLIPSELGQLTNLKHLHLHSNALSGLIPGALSPILSGLTHTSNIDNNCLDLSNVQAACDSNSNLKCEPQRPAAECGG